MLQNRHKRKGDYADFAYKFAQLQIAFSHALCVRFFFRQDLNIV